MCCKCCPDWVCPQWPDRCCLCLPKKAGVVLTGTWSILWNLALLLPSIFILVQPSVWTEAYTWLENWVVNNHWDSAITSTALRLVGGLNSHFALFLIIVIAFSALHIFNALLLILGALLEKRLLILPWIIQELFAIIIIGAAFVFWAFFSFFVHVLVAVLFPLIAGLLLGIWIYFWRNVKSYFHLLGVDTSQHQGTVYRKLPAGTRNLLGQ